MGRHQTSIDLLKYAENHQTFKAGDVIFKEGDSGKLMFVVKAGSVELRVQDQTVEQLDAGAILGEMALLDAEKRSATAVAATDCQLVPIDQERFTFLVRQTPYFAVEVMQIMARRLRRMNATRSQETRRIDKL